MLDRASACVPRALFPTLTEAGPSSAAGSGAASSSPTRAALLQAPWSGTKRDRAAAGLPERAGQRNRAAQAALLESAAPGAGQTGLRTSTGLDSPISSPPRTLIGAAPLNGSGSPIRPTCGVLTATPPSPASNPDAYAMLTNRLHRPDLYALTTQLDAQLGSDNWAFTGSVALQIHGMALTQDSGRPPGDADIEINEVNHDFFVDQVRTLATVNEASNALQSPRDADGNREKHYVFDGTLNVDLLPLERRLQNPGRRVRVGGVPVLTLEVLRANKQAYTNKESVAQDLERIDALLALRQAAPASAPAAASPQAVANAFSMRVRRF